MSSTTSAIAEALAALAHGFLDQDQDIAFSFKGNIGDFVVVSFSVTDTINAPFEIQVELASHSDSVDLHALLDEPATLGIHHKYDENIRYFNGTVTEAVRGDSGSRWTFYSVTLRPSIHRLMHGSDCRIWQNKTVPDIVKEVFSDYNITEVDWKTEGNHLPREYCTQYRENHLAFIERLFAEEGIFYYFQHDVSSHRLIITDQPETLSKSPALDTLEYNANVGGLNKGTWVSQYSQHERLRSSSYTMRDYTFKKPAYDQHHQEEAQDRAGLNGSYDLYDYPGRYKEPDAGQPFTQHRMESVRVDATTGHGTTNNIHLCTGWRFSLSEHPDQALNIEYLLLSVTHTGQQPTALEQDASGDPSSYSASFVTMPSKLAYRPPLARKPLVDGPQMATVTGPAGEEIYCDEHGRVKVQFPWDRYGKKDEHSSCWIRVSQNWAGGTWGHIAIPRIGHEVIVDYLEGDPDQPIVTGRTYHATNKSPYPLPDHKTKMVIRSDTHQGDGFNEISFEDQNNKEKIYLHAEKDHELHIENNRAKRVDRNQSESVGNNKSIEVGNNHHEVIGGNMTLMVGPNKLQAAVLGAFKKFTGAIGDLTNKLGLPDTLNMGEGNMIIGVAKNKAETVMLSSTEVVGAGKAITVGGGFQTVVGGVQNTTVGIGSYEEIGQNKVTVVGKQYEIVCGDSKILMKEDGTISITGKKILLDAEELLRGTAKDVKIN